MAINVSDVAKKLSSDPEFEAHLKENPAEALASLATSPIQWDAWIYRIVVLALGLTLLAAAAGGIWLSVIGKDTPQILTALGSAAVGALAGLLAPSPAVRG
jgi:predicted permease